MRIFLIAATLVLEAACGSQPELPSADPVAEPAAAPAALTSVTTVQQAKSAGYKIVNEKGVTLYCREQLKTGSHLRKETICLTAEELEASREAARRNLDRLQRQGQMSPPQGT